MTTRDPRRKLHYAGIVRAPVVLVMIAASSGCFIVPKPVTSQAVIATERVDVPPVANPPMQIELASKGLRINVRAIAPRVCTSEQWELVDVTRSKSVGMFVLGTSGTTGREEDVLILIGVLLAPITLTLSGIVTGIDLAASDDKTTRERHKTKTWSYDCPIVGAGLALALTVPSGAITELTTGPDGSAYFDVPITEAERGVVAVQVSGLAPREVPYCRTGCAPHVVAATPSVPAPPTDRPSCLKQRSERMLAAQQVSDIKERTRQLLSLPVCAAR
jgi:hypothetical protein